MRVKLIQHTQNLLDTIYTGARTCYNAGSPIDMWLDVCTIPTDKKLKLVSNTIKSGHLSVLEHSQFTFAIEGVSRALLAQLTRHRIGIGFSVQSQRYVEFKDGSFDYVVPKTIEKNPELNAIFESYIETVSGAYKIFIDKGIPPEDARAVLPNACCTNITCTVNLRELMHLCNERLCNHAQSEIREMVGLMVKEVLSYDEWLKPYLVPKCEVTGFCNERKGCGRKPSKGEMNNGN